MSAPIPVEDFDELEIATLDEADVLRSHHYEPVAKVGRGANSMVFKVTHKVTGVSYACKVITHKNRWRGLCGKPNIPGENQKSAELESRKDVKQEIAALQACTGHKNIIGLEEVITGKRHTFIICELGDAPLSVDEPQSEHFARKLFKGIIEGAAYIHSKDVVHGDLKPNNTLIKNGEILLLDFGTAQLTGSGQRSTSGGTAPFVPPESIDRIRSDGTGSIRLTQLGDAWACGIILYYILHAKIPWECYEGEELWEAMHREALHFRADLSKDALNLLSSLLALDPEKRLPVNKCLQHRWFEESKPH